MQIKIWDWWYRSILEKNPAYPKNEPGQPIEMEPADIIALAKHFDIMIVEDKNGEIWLALEMKGKRFHQR